MSKFTGPRIYVKIIDLKIRRRWAEEIRVLPAYLQEKTYPMHIIEFRFIFTVTFTSVSSRLLDKLHFLNDFFIMLGLISFHAISRLA